MSNEDFHEIQLNGKQLVFLFMAATVVAVVIFLCGVMVGRGVDPQRASIANGAADRASLDPTAAVLDAPPPPTGVTAGALVTAGETLTYADRLEDPNPPAEALAPPVETAASLSAPEPAAEPLPQEPDGGAARADDVAAASLASAAREEDGRFGEPAGTGFVVQVAAVGARAEAEAIAQRLSTKGYPAFVTTPGNGAPSVFRVRVGKYDDRGDAESVAGRLEREEQFKPWITR